MGKSADVFVELFFSEWWWLPDHSCLIPRAPPLSLESAAEYVCHSGILSPVLSAVDILLFNPTLLPFFLGPSVNPGKVWGRELWEDDWRHPGSLALLSAWQWWLLDRNCHVSIFGLCPQGLCPTWGSAVLYTDPSGRIAGGTESASAVSILPSPSTTVNSTLCPAALMSVLLPLLLACLLWFSYLHMFQCMALSDVFVCCIGNPLLNYSCSTCCDFKGIDQGAFLMPPCFWHQGFISFYLSSGARKWIENKCEFVGF